MWWLAPVVVGAGGAALLVLGRRLATTDARNPVVSTNLRYQPAALAVALVALGLVRVLVPEHADYLVWGNWDAPATGLGVLGVADGDSWGSVGLTFLVVMTVVTSVVVWLQSGRGRASVASMLRALPWALSFSVVNALTEELLFRVTLAESLGPVLTAGWVAGISAVLFGIPHWFGSPGRLPGVLLAGFMGWFLTLSILQTGGIGWAWLIHGMQDVVILAVLIAGAQRTSGASLEMAATR